MGVFSAWTRRKFMRNVALGAAGALQTLLAIESPRPLVIQVAEQSVQERSLRLAIKALDVQQAAIVGVHDHRYPVGARALPHQ